MANAPHTKTRTAKKSATKPAATKKAPPVRVPKRPTPEDRIPRVVENPTLDEHLAIVSRAVFQAGMSWAFIDARWDDYLQAFENFECRKVAEYDSGDVERILESGTIMRSRSKIDATIRNAKALLAIERDFGSVRAYQESFQDYAAARKDAQQRLSFMGDLNVYYWRFRTGASVPPFNEWMTGQGKDHPRMREMLQARRRPPP